MNDIGKQIKKKREELGWTQEELASKMGYKSKSTINKIELGINDVAQTKIVKFADILGTSIPYIMGWDDESINSASEIETDKNADADLDKMYDEWKDEKEAGLAAHIKALREGNHITLSEMSKELDIPVKTLKEYETGIRKIPYSVVKKMAKYFDVKLELLYGIEFESENEEEVQASIRRLRMAERWNKEFGKITFSEEELDEIINFTKYLISKREK